MSSGGLFIKFFRLARSSGFCPLVHIRRKKSPHFCLEIENCNGCEKGHLPFKERRMQPAPDAVEDSEECNDEIVLGNHCLTFRNCFVYLVGKMGHLGYALVSIVPTRPSWEYFLRTFVNPSYIKYLLNVMTPP